MTAKLAKAQMSAVCTGQIFDLWLARYIENENAISEEEKIELLYRYSREIEHSDENLKMIEEIMAGHKVHGCIIEWKVNNYIIYFLFTPPYTVVGLFHIIILYLLISTIQISCIHFILHIIQTAIVSIRNNRLALVL